MNVYAGLCGTCSQSRQIATRKGSHFTMCERSRTDPAFARYPPLPVLDCPGYEAVVPDPTLTQEKPSREGKS